MTGRIVPLHGNEHRETLSNLPWYVTGRLNASEYDQVEAHLSVCPECQADLRFERRLEAEFAALPIEVEHGWTLMQRRLNLGGDPRAPRPAIGARLVAACRDLGRTWRGAGPGLGWALAIQMALLLIVGVLATPPAQPARYRTLGAAQAAQAGNLVVIFRPDTSERDLRRALTASHARLVDGPTAADAYVLRVPAGERLAALAKLRGRADIVLAQPIDAPGPS